MFSDFLVVFRSDLLLLVKVLLSLAWMRFVLKFPSLCWAVCSLFSNSLVPFERFDPCSQILYFLCSGLLFVLKFPSPLQAVCSFILQSVVSFERFAPSPEILLRLSSGLLPVSYFLISVERFARCVVLLFHKFSSKFSCEHFGFCSRTRSKPPQRK